MIEILLTKQVTVKWCSRTKYHYIDKGYNFTKIGDIFTANINDVTHGSDVMVDVRCDYCGKTYQTKYSTYLKTSKNGTNACKKCSPLKVKETCMEKYGVENVFCTENIKKKSKETCLKKYGVENVSKSDAIQKVKAQNNFKKYGVTNTSKLQSVKDKVIQTNLERFGVEYPMQTDEFQKRIKETSLKKYGVEHFTQSQVVKDKQRKTMLERYGVVSPTQNPDILKKSIESRYKHGNFTCSKQQFEVYTIIGGELNYPFKNFVIDIAFPDEKIAIEWDGSGHDLSVRLGHITKEKFIRNENFRNISLFNDDWKIIRFITHKDKVSHNIKDIYDYCYTYLQNGGHNIQVLIDEQTIKTKHSSIKFNDISALND